MQIAHEIAAHLIAAGYQATARMHQDGDRYIISVSGEALATPVTLVAFHGYGRNANRITISGYSSESAQAHGLHYSESPGLLGKTTVASDATGKRAASQCISRILQPAQAKLQTYADRIAAQARNAQACDAIEARLASLGMLSQRHTPLSDSERKARQSVRLYKSVSLPNGNSLTIDADCHADGRVTVTRAYIPAARDAIDGIAWLYSLVTAIENRSN